MSVRRHLTATEIKSKPYAVWNAFVDLLAMEDYEDLDRNQRPAHLAFWYDSEVQNGGHFQYLENRGIALVPESIDALRTLGAVEHAKVLTKAYSLASAKDWGGISSVEEFVDKALASPFSELDASYHSCRPSIQEILERHLESNRDLYVAISDSVEQ